MYLCACEFVHCWNLHEFLKNMCFSFSSNNRSWRSFPKGTYGATLFFLMSPEYSIAWTLVWILVWLLQQRPNSRSLNKAEGTVFMWEFQQVVIQGQATQLYCLIQSPRLFCFSAFSQYMSSFVWQKLAQHPQKGKSRPWEEESGSKGQAAPS